MKPTHLVTAALVLSLLSSISARAGDDRPLIESIRGAKTVVIQSAEGERAAGVGTPLNPGDRIKTTGDVSTRIVYKDRSQLSVGRASEVEVQGNEGGETQWTKLHAGQVQGKVTRAAMKPKSYRYGVRTKSAVMGVRGTDFVVDSADGQDAKVHTLDGQVDVAQDESSLLSGKGLAVLKNQFTEVKPGQAIPKPKQFDRGKYLQELNAKQPDFQSFMKQAPKPQGELEKLRSKSDAAPPKMPEVKAPEVKAPEAPKMPEIKAPEAPKAPPVQAPAAPALPKNPFKR